MIFLKKAILLIPVILAVSACSSAPGAAGARVPDIAFTASADISYGGLDLAADITRNESGEWEFRITEPYALEGLTMTVSGGSTTAGMLGSTGAADLGENAVSMAKAIAQAYDAAAASGETPGVTETGYKLSGTSELGAYSVSLDKDGIPVMFTSDAGKLTAGLKDFTKITPPEKEARVVE